MNYASSRFNVSVNGLYKLRGYQASSTIKTEVTQDYFVLNAKAEYNIIKNKFGIFTQVDNLFNRNYSDLLGTPMPMRWWQWGARVTL